MTNEGGWIRAGLLKLLEWKRRPIREEFNRDGGKIELLKILLILKCQGGSAVRLKTSWEQKRMILELLNCWIASIISWNCLFFYSVRRFHFHYQLIDFAAIHLYTFISGRNKFWILKLHFIFSHKRVFSVTLVRFSPTVSHVY